MQDRERINFYPSQQPAPAPVPAPILKQQDQLQPNEFKISAQGKVDTYLDMAFGILESGKFKHLKFTARGNNATMKASEVVEYIYEHGPLCQITEKYIPVFNLNGSIIQEGHFLISLLDSPPVSTKNAKNSVPAPQPKKNQAKNGKQELQKWSDTLNEPSAMPPRFVQKNAQRQKSANQQQA